MQANSRTIVGSVDVKEVIVKIRTARGSHN